MPRIPRALLSPDNFQGSLLYIVNIENYGERKKKLMHSFEGVSASWLAGDIVDFPIRISSMLRDLTFF